MVILCSMNKLLFILPIIVIVFTNCTVRTLYLSLSDHLNMPNQPTCIWEISKKDFKSKRAIDSLMSNIKQLQSVLIISNDSIKFEWYKSGFSERTAHNVKSTTKSIISLLAGIAIDKGYLTLNTDLKSIFPEIKMDSLSGKITIRDLLTMKAGFPYEEQRYYWLVCSSLNPVKASLHRRKNINPGVSSEYSNISANLLGYAVSKATNMKLEDFADKQLFLPLGISNRVWARDLKGNNATAGDLFLCPRDLSKIGKLMLDKGNSNGLQIISEEWIKESTSKKTVLAAFPCNLEYGYLWWLDSKFTPGTFCGIGGNGQILYVSPSDNTIIITTVAFTKDGWPQVLEFIRKVIKLIRIETLESRAQYN